MGVHIIQEGEEGTPRLPAPRQPVEKLPIHDIGVFSLALGKLQERQTRKSARTGRAGRRFSATR